jgi:hypothetical protein
VDPLFPSDSELVVLARQADEQLNLPNRAAAALAKTPALVILDKTKLCEELAKLPSPPAANLWPGLRRQLKAAANIAAEDIPGVIVPFLRFHFTLAPMLWARQLAQESLSIKNSPPGPKARKLKAWAVAQRRPRFPAHANPFPGL